MLIVIVPTNKIYECGRNFLCYFSLISDFPHYSHENVFRALNSYSFRYHEFLPNWLIVFLHFFSNFMSVNKKVKPLRIYKMKHQQKTVNEIKTDKLPDDCIAQAS